MRSYSDFKWVASRFSLWKWRLCGGFICLFFAALAPILDPMLMRSLIDKALPGHDLRLAIELVLGIGLCYLSQAVFVGVGYMINLSTSQNCVRDLRLAILSHLHRLSADYHEGTPIGEKMTRIEYDVTEISNFGADAVSQSVTGLILLAMNVAIMAKLSLTMTLTILPSLPLFIVIQKYFVRQMRLRAGEVRAKVDSAASFITEHLTAVPQIQLLGAEQRTRQRAGLIWNEMLRAQWVERLTQHKFSFSINGLFTGAVLIVLIFGCRKVLANTLTLGGLVAFYTYVTRIFEPIGSTMVLYARLQSIGASIRQVRSLLELEPSVQDTGWRTLRTVGLNKPLQVKDILFSYGEKRVFEGLTFEIGARDRVAIIGPSGSGKSTLARLLVRAFDPQSGSIVLEGGTLPEYRLDSLRSTIYYLSQEPIIFQATVRENLLHANPLATEEELYRVIHAAQFGPVLAKLPEGLETRLGPGAITLSVGERQRLAVARALLKNAAVLILDEATSALDGLVERAMLASVASFQLAQTLIIISHRLSSVTWADNILLLQGGRIAASGNHATLYQQSIQYRALFDAALSDIDP